MTIKLNDTIQKAAVTPPEPEVKHSVTAGDVNPGTGPASFYFGWLQPYLDYVAQQLPKLPPYWSQQRDRILASTINHEDFWSSAIAIAITKTGSQTWEIQGGDSPKPLQIKQAQELFHNANAGEGWGHFISQTLTDFLTTDNGCFIEIERASNSPASRITGIHHLDSLRCLRTGNPETPVIYMALDGEWHYLNWYQVFSIADNPNPRRNYFGVGRCAASRAYRRIRRTVAMELYVYEKISGGSPQELHFITGITPQQLEDVLSSNEATRRAKGFSVYGGAAVVAMMVKESQIGHINIPIASMPDKFDFKLEFDQMMLAYANAIGLDSQDLQPLTGHAIGTGSQSQVLDDKSKGRGLAFFNQRWTHFVNNWLLPGTTKWVFVEKDLREEQQVASVQETIVGTAVSMVKDVGILTPEQAVQWLVDKDVLPKEFLAQPDITPEAALSDNAQPEDIDQMTGPEQAVNEALRPLQEAIANAN